MLKALLKTKSTAASEAKKILKSVDEEAIRSIWDIYSHIQNQHPEQYDGFDKYTYDVLTHTWEGLKKIVEYQGDFRKSKEDEKHFLFELRDGYLAYSDVIHTLIDHHDDTLEADYIFKEHPKLHDIIPKQYDTTQQVIEVLLEISKDYQWQLEHFSMKHYGELNAALGIARSEDDENELYVLPD